MDLKEEMLARYRRAYDEHPGLEQFRGRKKALLWGAMGLFALQKLMDAMAVGNIWAFFAGLVGLLIPGIFLLTAWRGGWKFSLVLLLPAAVGAASFLTGWLPMVLEGRMRPWPPFYAAFALAGAAPLYLAGVVAWLSVPEKNRAFGAILNQVNEELILRSKQMAAASANTTNPAAPARQPVPPEPEAHPAPPVPVNSIAPAPAPENALPSCYRQIAAAAGPEGLPEDFSLDYDGLGEEKPRFAEGARDGIAMYHTSVTPGDVTPLHELLGLIAAGYLGAGKRLEEFFVPDGPSMLNLIDGMQEWVLDHREELDPGAVHRFAMTTLRESRNRECVKFALSLLELVNVPPEDRPVISTLALCDEFTLFCMYVIRGWEDGQEEMFRLAKLVHGWGRIFLVHELEPDTPEVKDWLLREGWRNTILDNYSTRVCAEEGGLAELLARESITREEYGTARALVAALLEEQPLPGISGMEDGAKLLKDYLRHAAALGDGEEDRKVREDVEGYLKKHTGQEGE